MHADIQTSHPTRISPRMRSVASFASSERQSLKLGAVRLEHFRGAGIISDGMQGMCSMTFLMPAAPPQLRYSRFADMQGGTWSASIAELRKDKPLQGGEILSFFFPLDYLSRSLSAQIHARSLEALPIDGAARMCLEMSRTCLSQREPAGPVLADALAGSLVELAKLAFIEQFCTRRTETIRETVRARIQAYVQRNLTDPDLTIERIAERMQCTKRYLHKVFSDEGETLNQYIWAQRLELCRVRLARDDLAGKSITQIAFACGFSNAAHFSRSFRARFGQAPRTYRRIMLGR